MDKKTRRNILYDEEHRCFIFECPHCDQLIQVMENQTACCIFRHGYMKDNNTQMNPHSPKELCDMLAKEDKIYGCGKPFKLINENGKFKFVEICNYI